MADGFVKERHLRTLIAKRELRAVEELIVAHAVECCPLRLGDAENYARIGNSRYGGVPDLPPSLPWPRHESRYSNFLMQVNLGDLPALTDSPLPSRGMLYFFVAEDEACTEVACRVLCYEGDLDLLRRAEAPADEELAHEYYRDLVAHRIVPASGIDLPGYGSSVFEQVEEQSAPTEQGDAGDRYFRLIDDALGRRDGVRIVGQILGYPSALNDDMRENAYLMSAGERARIYDYEYRRAHAAELQARAEEWRLLWRIDSSHDVGVTIWDAGSFYVLIRPADLGRRDFAEVYTEIETG